MPISHRDKKCFVSHMPQRMRCALPFVLLAAALASGRAHAQGPHVSPFASELALAVAAAPPPRLDPEIAPTVSYMQESEVRKQQRRGRLMLSAGAGAVTGAVVHVALMSTLVQCTNRPPVMSYVTGTLVGGMGLGLTLGGASKLGRVPRDQRRPASAVRKLGLVTFALATELATQLVLFMASSRDLMCDH